MIRCCIKKTNQLLGKLSAAFAYIKEKILLVSLKYTFAKGLYTLIANPDCTFRCK